MKMNKIIVACLCIVATLAGFAIPAFASNVVYDDSVFKINADGSGDLFDSLKGCMPGDILEQSITVKNDTKNKVTIDLYLRSYGADEDSKKLLSQMKLTVANAGKAVLYEGPADEATGLTDWVSLGTVYSGGEIEIVLLLEIPITVGDEFQNAVGKITWEFRTDEHAIDTGIILCPICEHEMENKPVVDPETGEEYIIHHCNKCGNEEDMVCEICGERMKKVIIQGEDGHYYIYYVCLSDSTHHTDPSPQTGDTLAVVWLGAAPIALLGLFFCILVYRRRKKEAA